MIPTLATAKSFISRRPYLFLSLILLALLSGGLVWKFGLANNNDKVQFTTATIERGNIENLVTATGILQPRDYVDVGAQVSGQLKTLLVEVGSEVKKGDLLAEIDATVYAANVDSTRAQLTSQQAQLRDREAQLKLAEINYKRQKNLHAADATTREAVETAEAQLTSVRAQLDMLKAQIKQTESNLRAQEANLDYANIYAPMDGTVVSIASRQGQTLNANQTAPTIMRIADLSTMTVQTQVSEADVGKLRVGMPVYFTTLGSQGRRWYSTLDRIQPTPEVLNNVVLYNALFDVPNEQRVLMTQMSTQVFFISDQVNDALLVPVSALTFTRPSRPGSDGATAPARESSAAGVNPEGAKMGTDSATRAASSPPNNMANGVEGADRQLRPARAERPAKPATRRATVQVVTAKNQQETREVVIGVSNRIHAEVISGLSEGEVVVTGTRTPGGPNGTNAGPGRFNPRMLR
jgi:macrolide-specific efflux system membrane fusion protein